MKEYVHKNSVFIQLYLGKLFCIHTMAGQFGFQEHSFLARFQQLISHVNFFSFTRSLCEYFIFFSNEVFFIRPHFNMRFPNKYFNELKYLTHINLVCICIEHSTNRKMF